MEKLFKNKARPIVEEFYTEIVNNRIPIANDRPIPFRDDRQSNKVRKAFKVSIELLRFRKDNGRIASDVITYENSKGRLNEATDHGQALLKRFLELKDPEPTSDLSNSILKEGQDEYAVITSDGFLINGNRRKMVLEKLLNQYPGDERFKYLKVVMLPALDDEEPAPTYLEIEQLENRYQLRKSGKAEYYNFDKALSIKRKIELGMSLEEQLRDDPNFSELSSKEFRKKIKEFDEQYLKPLECIDKYLLYLNRSGHYNTISEGRGDSEGRWQAFLDYYNYVYKKLADERSRIKIGINEDEVGKIENIAFKIIRKRELVGIEKKAHQIMRDIPKLVANTFAKKELFQLLKIDSKLPEQEILDEDGNYVDEKTKDNLWGNKYATDVIWHVKKAYDIVDQKKEMDTPIDLLNASLDKLNHPNMDLEAIELSRLDEAMKLARDIQSKANELEHSIYSIKKESKRKLKQYKK